MHIGSYPTVEDAVAAIEDFWLTGIVQHLRAMSWKHDISVLAQMENMDF